MFLQILIIREFLSALMTFKPFDAKVGVHMTLQVLLERKGLVAVFIATDEWSLGTMGP
jgi:hypothetical protein